MSILETEAGDYGSHIEWDNGLHAPYKGYGSYAYYSHGYSHGYYESPHYYGSYGYYR